MSKHPYLIRHHDHDWRHLIAIVVAVLVLVVVLILMVAKSTAPAVSSQLGPYPTGDGDAVEVTP